MSALDKAKNKADELAGRAQEKSGEATGDKSQEAHGKTDRAKADLESAGEKVKDAIRK